MFCLAIAVYKFVIVFCVSMKLQQTGTNKFAFFSYLTTFSLMFPVGATVGILMSEVGGGGVHEVTIATLQGVAGGTILYIVMFEILNNERLKDVPGIIQLLGLLIGFSLMMIIEIFGKYMKYVIKQYKIFIF